MKQHEVILIRAKRVKDIERLVDQLYENFNSFLFENEKDAIELVKHKNIVQALKMQQTGQRCKVTVSGLLLSNKHK